MCAVARDAGAAILQVYGDEDFGVQIKLDDSPLTRADLAAHNIIVDGLQAKAPGIPVLSEESDGISFAERSSWDRYFLVDPLDGTKEFINRNGEFSAILTVNSSRLLMNSFVPSIGSTRKNIPLETSSAWLCARSSVTMGMLGNSFDNSPNKY